MGFELIMVLARNPFFYRKPRGFIAKAGLLQAGGKLDFQGLRASRFGGSNLSRFP
jgi:hypothetical protein